MYKKSIFRFRQDLRIFDNTGLFNAIKNSKQIIPIFIFDTNILSRFLSNDKRLGFLKDALNKLSKDLENIGSYLIIKIGDPKQILTQLVKEYQVQAIFTNKSYGSYGKQRDKFIENNINIDFNSFNDFLLVNPEDVPIRKVFTPFYKQWKQFINFDGFLEINKIDSPNLYFENIQKQFKKINSGENKYWNINGYEDILNNFDFGNYENTRNLPYINGTSKLSPYTRFGLISVRQIYNKIIKSNYENDVYLSEIAWREFWNHIAINFPWTLDLEFLEKRRGISWENDQTLFDAWQEGKTGYPMVDAGMRQLKEENWIHNRVRMVVASFLSKDLLIDRRYGEKYFEKYLIDYDRNVNIGNWQWASSVGADPKPLRIFNPMLQSQRFDPNCEYIKKYIPELREYKAEQIHNPLKYNLGYAKPIVDHFVNSKKAKEIYMKANDY
ncbi:cryptochrome/photolyase family protein [Candidatus Vampirococcus lugosii]|uniref:Deoxyribodipyrimidine photolyase n=1 Tax=Candidatus Vampirococcus lugosii TaxID=2789015 RepID=A0ABS5QKJ7_9BACT|nr:deoxyribodipyrimidine photo-lyase [Candidatus Vampirococcus lugosii]MBS8121602.1 Deoxyribodipyrimidine photolyase [Candidatus Vampirococcus lugosii]